MKRSNPAADGCFSHDAAERVLNVLIVERNGAQRIYPNCKLSRLFTDLLDQLTLTERDVEKIKLLGYIVRTKSEML